MDELLGDLIKFVILKIQKRIDTGLLVSTGLSAGLGLAGIASCGIPFVPPVSTLAIVLGILGGITALVPVVLAWPCGRRTRVLFIAIGAGLLLLNGAAVWAGRLGKHLIDYLEGH